MDAFAPHPRLIAALRVLSIVFALSSAAALALLCWLLPLPPGSVTSSHSFPEALLFIGRFHPVLLHFPIGLLLFAGGLRLLTLHRHGTHLRPALTLCLWVGAASAVIAAATGWLLAMEGGYSGPTFELHWRLGLSTVALALALLVLHHLHFRGVAIAQGAVWMGMLSAMGLGAHQGGALTHGEEFLAEHAPGWLRPLLGGRPAPPQGAENASAGVADEGFIATAAFFERYCTDCHGASKAKGGQRLHTREAIALGGKSGPTVLPGDPEGSLFLRRMLLPVGEKKHMPPSGEPQPTQAEIALLRRWVAEGAPGLSGQPARLTQGSEPKNPTHSAQSTSVPQRSTPQAISTNTSPLTTTTMKPAPVLVAAALLSVDAASGQTPADPKAVAQKVHQLFERRCAECHDTHKAGGKVKGGFSFVLDFARLRSDPDYVNLSSPENSPVYRLLIDSDPESRMPQLTKAEKEKGLSDPEPLPGAESALVLQWIQLGAPTPDGQGARELIATKPPAEPEKPASSVPEAPAPVAKRTPIRESDAMLELARDLRAQPEHDRAQVRYISILPQHNNTVEISDAQLEVARNGVRKLLNSLSTNPKVATFAEVGPGKAFFRFHLDDLGWTAATWDRIVSFYPYGLEENDLGREAGSPVPVLRADWLATNGTRPPLYHEILGLPATLDELNRKLGVDLVGNLQKNRAIRAGFVSSGISRFNRMIERHDLGAWPGYYWLSYDFAGSNGQRDLLRNPLGPAHVQLAGGKRAFEHDGGELIFSLPNGFQGYYLTNAAGGRLDIAPTSIVGDIGGVTGRPDIVNGLSCIICHNGGMKEQPGNKDAVTDQVRALAGRGGFSAAEEEAILGLYREQKEVDAAIGTDRAAFKAALAKAGVTQGSTEPIAALAMPFEERLTTARAAAELGLAAEELERKLGERDDFGILRIQLGQRALPRDGFGEQFADLARRLGIGRVRLAGAKLQGSVDVLRDEQEKKRPKPLLFELRTDKSMYRKDEPVNVTIFAAQQGHLRLFYKDAAGQVTTLFPSAALEQQAKTRGIALDDRIPGGQPVLVSGKGSQTKITVFIDGPKFGREQLGAVLTDAPIEDDAEFRAELERTGSIEVAVSSVALKSAVTRVNNPGGRRNNTTPQTPRLGVQIVNLHTSPK